VKNIKNISAFLKIRRNKLLLLTGLKYALEPDYLTKREGIQDI